MDILFAEPELSQQNYSESEEFSPLMPFRKPCGRHGGSRSLPEQVGDDEI
ncbi:hypothetical protein BLJAPNOD_06519 [Ensifer sp. M14]|nr:hypothetical protein BLJAPNOD_06519 [Ensifer sp. M14]